MCYGCEHAIESSAGYYIYYTCEIKHEVAEIVDTYFNKRTELIKCPKDNKNLE